MNNLSSQERLSQLLYEDMISIYDIDLVNNTYKTIKYPNTTSIMSNRIDDVWSSAVMDFANEVTDDTKWVIHELADTSKLLQTLKVSNLKEYVYKIKGTGEWRKATLRYAGKNENGFESAFLLVSLFDVYAIGKDTFFAEFKRQQEELLIQADIVRALSRDYINIYSVDPKSDTLRIVKLQGKVLDGIEYSESGIRESYSYSAVFGKYIESTIHPDDQPFVKGLLTKEGMDKCLDGVDEYVGTYRAIEGNKTHYFEYKIMPLEAIDRVIIGFRNIDVIIEKEAARSEELSKALSQADSANKAKTTFLFNMSHDIRTPMNAIIGFSELMESHWEDREQTFEYLKKLKTSSKFLLSLINNVLEMARIESGKTVLNEVPWNTGRIVSDLSYVFEDDLKKHNIEFKRSIDVTHKSIYCDATKTREIILNVLSNAVKYTPDGGSISMELKEIPCEKEGYATFVTTITDTGIGMSKDFLPHIFEPFSRERNATESKITGTGLGMPIVKELVRLMDGNIEAESELGKGSKFTITLTHKIASSEELHGTEATYNADVRFDGKRVLLAEDNELNAEIAMTILEDTGVMVELAHDGKECVEMIENHAAGYYNVVLMDVQMPVMSGYEAAKAIREMHEDAKRSIPILAVTANAFDEDRKAAFDAGMNGHIAKPISVHKLSEYLSKYLDK